MAVKMGVIPQDQSGIVGLGPATLNVLPTTNPHMEFALGANTKGKSMEKCKTCKNFWIEVISPAVKLPTCKITERMACPDMKQDNCEHLKLGLATELTHEKNSAKSITA